MLMYFKKFTIKNVYYKFKYYIINSNKDRVDSK